MKKIILLISVLFPLTLFAQVSINGSDFIEINPEASTGLKKIYVVRDTSGASMSYTATSPTIQWEKFSSLGGGYAETLNNIEHSGNTYTIPLEGNMGYIITDGTTQTCVWVCNYADFPYNITGLTVAESDCDRVLLDVSGSAPEIPYYTVNGRRMVVEREIKITYSTLRFDENAKEYVQTATEQQVNSVTSSVAVPAPLCSTSFTIHPDRFASTWGEGRSAESSWIESVAVEATVWTEQVENTADNQQGMGDSGGGLGGSAPAEITFFAAVTDAAIFRRWEFSNSSNFEDAQLTYSDLVVSYTFEDSGSTFIRFICDNASGSCLYESETFTVTIGDSRLDCPNAFSPGRADGVNDEWKVSYRSLIEFHCEIFNRWGQKLATLTDPSQGWDGMIGGKPVPSGVYFYVINAVGSDGKKYKRSGDINVVSSRRNSTAPSVE